MRGDTESSHKTARRAFWGKRSGRGRLSTKRGRCTQTARGGAPDYYNNLVQTVCYRRTFYYPMAKRCEKVSAVGKLVFTSAPLRSKKREGAPSLFILYLIQWQYLLQSFMLPQPLINKGFPLISDKKICILTYKKKGCIIGIAVTKNIHPF